MQNMQKCPNSKKSNSQTEKIQTKKNKKNNNSRSSLYEVKWHNY